MWLQFCFIIYLCTFIQGDDTPSKIIKLRQGAVRGYKEGDLYAFYGIPYATAPTGKYRFMAPLPGPAWLNTFEAVDKGIICHQFDPFNIIPKTLQMEENCLIANVFVPDIEEKNLPVVVYVHGGAYVMGFGNFVTYKDLVQSSNSIVVTFNYRLGAHGFLCLGTEDIPGNAGMKDQVALLRWVNQNIASFGGNPDDVTLAGYSAGSSAVDLLMLSKSADGLFNKVIPESGANTAAFSIQSDPIANAKEYAKLINFTNVDDFYALEEFYKTVPYEILNSADVASRFDNTFLMSPCIERNIDDEPFLTKSPFSILKSGNFKKLPMLYGFAKMEGLFRINLFDQWKEVMNSNFEVLLPPDLKFKDEEEKKMIGAKIKKFYFGDSPVGTDNILEYINFFTDIIFAYPTLRSTKLQIEAGNKDIYLYEYSFVHDGNPLIPHTDIRGADHCAQTHAVADFSKSLPLAQPLSQKYLDMKNTTRKIWSNFIKTGKPVPEGSDLPTWPPAGKGWSPHMVLDQPLQLKDSLLKERALFWEDIYDKYYREPLSPSPPMKHTEL